MRVKWHGQKSSERKLNGGGPQGSTLGVWEYLAQSNDNANCVDPDYKYKFVDDLSVLEKINLLTIGLTNFNCKNSFPSDIPTDTNFIPSENLTSAKFIEEIQKWTTDKKMKLNQKKTKVMIFNFTNNYKFTTRLMMNNENIEVVNKSKLLGTIVSDKLTWDENTNYLIKKAYKRMQLLHKVANFTSSRNEKKEIYISYIRSLLEQSCVVWHSSLTQENSNDLERVQKSAVKIISGNNYSNYEQAKDQLNLDTLN